MSTKIAHMRFGDHSDNMLKFWEPISDKYSMPLNISGIDTQILIFGV